MEAADVLAKPPASPGRRLAGSLHRQCMQDANPMLVDEAVSAFRQAVRDGLSSSLKSPFRIACVNVRVRCEPESTCCRCASYPTKKKSLSRPFV